MIVVVFYLLAFISGIFIVWKFGQDEYYDEEKLIDLMVFSTGIGLFIGRISYFLFPAGQKELMTKIGEESWWNVLWLLNLNSGFIWWIGLIGFFSVAILLIWRWHWPYWPPLGFIYLGLTVAIVGKELLFFYESRLTEHGLVFGGAFFSGAFVYYLLRLGGEKKMVTIVDKISQISSKFKKTNENQEPRL